MDKDMLKYMVGSQVDLINNEELRTLVKKILEKLPEAFWTRECSKKYHPVDERGECGNIIHSLRVTKVGLRILETTVHEKIDLDMVRASHLLHDCMRHGLEGKTPFSVKDHPQLVREFIKQKGLTCELSEKMCDIIDTHMGVWGYPQYLPEVDLKAILHIADFIASQTDIEVKL